MQRFDIHTHPVIQLKIGTQLFQLIIATQWYWPPAVGYADRNSASDAASARLHIPAVIRPHSTDTDPPLGSASESEADSAVHEFKIAKASPSIDKGEKLRLSSCLWPSAARWSASGMLLRLASPLRPKLMIEDFRRVAIVSVAAILCPTKR